MGCDNQTAGKLNSPGNFLRRFLGIFGSCKKRAQSELFIVVTSDVMGRDPEIGRVLIKGFFETMKATSQLPHAIFFMNSAVRLTTTDDELVPLLKGIQDAGVEIYSCGTCLKHYGLEDRLRVGHRGSTGQVIEGMNDAQTVWI